MVQTLNKTPDTFSGITLEAFLQMPETQPASEYINGQILQKPMPQGEHSTLQRDLLFKLEDTLKPDRIARAFPELRCKFGNKVLVPDLTVFRCERIPRQDNGRIANVFEIAPDWVIEILSPDQGEAKVRSKILHCLDHGCEMGWMINTADNEVIAYPHNDRPRSFTTPEAKLPVPEWAAALELSIEELFGWLID
jgi:Uma2 family endonuclease